MHIKFGFLAHMFVGINSLTDFWKDMSFRDITRVYKEGVLTPHPLQHMIVEDRHKVCDDRSVQHVSHSRSV